MTKITGLREDIEMSQALKQQINQWLVTLQQQQNQNPPTLLVKDAKSAK